MDANLLQSLINQYKSNSMKLTAQTQSQTGYQSTPASQTSPTVQASISNSLTGSDNASIQPVQPTTVQSLATLSTLPTYQAQSSVPAVAPTPAATPAPVTAPATTPAATPSSTGLIDPVSALANTPDANKSKAQALIDAYQSILGRLPDEAGYAAHLKRAVDENASPETIRSWISGSGEADTTLDTWLTDIYKQYLGRTPQGSAETQAYRDAIKAGTMTREQVAASIAGSREAETYKQESVYQQKANDYVTNLMEQMYGPQELALKQTQESTGLAFTNALEALGRQIEQTQYDLERATGTTKTKYEQAMRQLLEQKAALEEQAAVSSQNVQRSYETGAENLMTSLTEYQRNTLGKMQQQGILRSGITGSLFGKAQTEYGKNLTTLETEKGIGLETIGRALTLGTNAITGQYGDLQIGMTSALDDITRQGALTMAGLRGQYGDIGEEQALAEKQFGEKYGSLIAQKGRNYQTAMDDYLNNLRNYSLNAEQLDVQKDQFQQNLDTQQQQWQAEYALKLQQLQQSASSGGSYSYGSGAEIPEVSGLTSQDLQDILNAAANFSTEATQITNADGNMQSNLLSKSGYSADYVIQVAKSLGIDPQQLLEQYGWNQ